MFTLLILFYLFTFTIFDYKDGFHQQNVIFSDEHLLALFIMPKCEMKRKEVKYLNLLKGAVDHCNEHVEQYNDHSDVIHSIEHITGVLNEFVSVVHNHWLHLRESKNGPKQCFEAFFYAVGFVRGTKRTVNMVHTLYMSCLKYTVYIQLIKQFLRSTTFFFTLYYITILSSQRNSQITTK